MGKLGLLFSGQGSQYQGMSLDFPKSSEFYHKVKVLTSLDLETVIQTGETLNETKNTQLAVFSHSMLAYHQLKELNPNISGVLGFSLGEYSALCSANIFNIDTAIILVYQRSIFMNEAALKTKGCMAAVLGLDEKTIKETLKEVSTGQMVVANLNARTQTVISGQTSALEESVTLLKQAGAKRVIPLNVSGAFHSPLMSEASENLETYLRDLEFNQPVYDIYMNVTGNKLTNENLKSLMVRQTVEPVRFVEMLDNMIKDGFTHLIEVGPGNVLTNLIKKQQNVEVMSFQSMTDYETLKGWLKLHGFIE